MLKRLIIMAYFSTYFLTPTPLKHRFPEELVPNDLLTANDPQMLCKHLSRFVVETRKANGDPYPPSTLHSILCGILRYMRENNVNSVNFLDKKDLRFSSFHKTLDYLFNHLHSEGIGRQTKKAEVLTREDERMLWDSGVMNLDVPKGLLNAVFYTTGKMFCLRGGQEHRFLKLSQIQRSEDKYVYHENVSKNINGSFKQLRVKSKVVPLYANPVLGEQCPVSILDKYISKLPPKAKDQDFFYAWPKNLPTRMHPGMLQYL